MAAYTKPQQRKNEERERLRGEGDQIKFTDLRFERWQVVKQMILSTQPYTHMHEMPHCLPVNE